MVVINVNLNVIKIVNFVNLVNVYFVKMVFKYKVRFVLQFVEMVWLLEMSNVMMIIYLMKMDVLNVNILVNYNVKLAYMDHVFYVMKKKGGI